MKMSKLIAKKVKNGAVPMIDYRETLRAAAVMMKKNHYAALMVTDKDHFDPLQYKGILTALHISDALGEGVDPDRAAVADHMTTRLIVATANDDVDGMVKVMVRHRLTHLPVIQDKKVAALINLVEILESENIDKDIQLQWLSDFTGAPGGDRNQVF